MILSHRTAGAELLFYRALVKSRRLSSEEAKILSVLEKGFSGECEYDRIFDSAGHGSVFVFRDIYLKIDGAVAQYDSLIVSDDGIVVNEIKNYSGLYRYENGKWYIRKSEVSEDALSQLRRAMGKLIKMRYLVRDEFSVTGKIVFPNIEFRLETRDEALRDSVVLRSELRHYLMQFKNMYAGRFAEKIDALIRERIVANPYFDKSADFSSVKNGLYCGACGGFELELYHYHLMCQKCGSCEKKETHLLRAIYDFKSLFLNEKLTKQRLLQFIDYKISERTVYRLLNKYCNRLSSGPGSYYTTKYLSFDQAYEKHENLNRYKDKSLV